jgi:hypothetical protein
VAHAAAARNWRRRPATVDEQKDRCGEPVRAALRVTIAYDQPGMLKHPEMPGRNSGHHVERLCKFRYRCLASGKPRKDCPPGWIGERREGRVKEVGAPARA